MDHPLFNIGVAFGAALAAGWAVDKLMAWLERRDRYRSHD